jgi:hypothetical protein
MNELEPDVFRSLPRWVKAYLAARVARRAIDTIDARHVPTGFEDVLGTLEILERAVETGVEVKQTNRGFTAARLYADAHGGNRSTAAHVRAALAVDDAFALVTNEARLGRGKMLPSEEFQIRKLLFARVCALQAAASAGVADALALAFGSDVERVRDAIASGSPWADTRPVARDFLAQYCEFDTAASLNGRSLIELSPLITDEFIRRLRRSPTLLYELTPRAFEELVARVFETFGFTVELTAQVRDGGRDVVAVTHSPTRLKYLIECKKYAPENRVGIEIVQRLHGVVAGDSATTGIVATTSTFTSPALEFLKRPAVEYRLSGKDFDGLRAWLVAWERVQRVSAVMGAGFTFTEAGLVIPDHTLTPPNPGLQQTPPSRSLGRRS